LTIGCESPIHVCCGYRRTVWVLGASYGAATVRPTGPAVGVVECTSLGVVLAAKGVFAGVAMVVLALRAVAVVALDRCLKNRVGPILISILISMTRIDKSLILLLELSILAS